MAKHIQSVRGSGVTAASRGELYGRIRPGDLIFCSGRVAISRCIEGLTDSPWSHVLMAWVAGPWCSQWLTLEATYEKGVHVGLLADYVNGYDGDLAVARRPVLSLQEVEGEINCGLSLLDDGYDWRQEVSVAARKMVATLPLILPKKELYCSGLQYVMSLATRYPLQRPAENYPTPEDNWTDPTVEPVCALLREAA